MNEEGRMKVLEPPTLEKGMIKGDMLNSCEYQGSRDDDVDLTSSWRSKEATKPEDDRIRPDTTSVGEDVRRHYLSNN